MSFRKIYYLTTSKIKYLRLIYTKRKQVNELFKRNKLKPLNRETKESIGKRFREFGFKNVGTKWHRYYIGISELNHTDYIPEVLFYTKIEPALNQIMMYPALEDKNLSDKFFPSPFLAKSIIKNMNGFYYRDRQQISRNNAIRACSLHNNFVIKPTIGTASGKGVKKIILDEAEDKSKFLDSLFAKYGSDFIVEEVVKQHPVISKLNPTSINTIRLMSYMRDDEVIPLSAVIRIGKAGAFTDNLSQGGMAVGITNEGLLKSFGVDEYGKKYFETDFGTTVKGFQIPHYEKVISTVKEQHKNMPHFRLISWDLAINDKSDVIMIEFNAVGQGLLLHQLQNGPLFGEYTDEILSQAQKFKAINRLLKFGK